MPFVKGTVLFHCIYRLINVLTDISFKLSKRRSLRQYFLWLLQFYRGTDKGPRFKFTFVFINAPRWLRGPSVHKIQDALFYSLHNDIGLENILWKFKRHTAIGSALLASFVTLYHGIHIVTLQSAYIVNVI